MATSHDCTASAQVSVLRGPCERGHWIGALPRLGRAIARPRAHAWSERRAMSTRLPAAFQRLVWSNLAAQSAEQLALAAAPIVAVLALGAGEAAAGILQAAQTLPFLIMSIPAGVLADRMSRVPLMASAEALRVLSLLAVLALIVSGTLNLPLLAVLGFIAATGTVAYSVTAPAVVPALVAPQALPRANGRIELARTSAFAAGPALGGALVGWIGGAPAFAIAAAFSAGAVALLFGIASRSERRSRRSIRCTTCAR